MSFAQSKARPIKLQDNETMHFLQLYAGERLLYDVSCKGYKERDLRLEAARRISRAMNIPGFGPAEVLTKFKNLRSSYCQELKKIAESEISGGEVYVPKVLWFDLMNSFIRPFVQQRSVPSSESRADLCSRESFEELSESQQETASDNDSETKPNFSNNFGETTNAGATTTRTAFKRQAEPETSSSKMRKVSHHEPQIEYAYGDYDNYDDVAVRPEPLLKKDVYHYFGKYVASALRTIGPPMAMRLQEQITRLVNEAMCPSTSYE